MKFSLDVNLDRALLAMSTKVTTINFIIFTSNSTLLGKISGKAPICEIRKQSLVASQFQDCHVAVKILPEYADKYAKSQFLQEINCMKDIGYCPYLVNLMGCIVNSEPYVLLLEYCENGDLRNYMKKRKEEVKQNFRLIARY